MLMLMLMLASLASDADAARAAPDSLNTVRVWDAQTGQCQHTLEGHSSTVADRYCRTLYLC
jgi:WD40 repeat protein